MKEIGTKLREAREKRNLSIQDVSVATKINLKTIQAMEEGDTDNLPAKPFLRGFVQTYSRYLDLNVDEIMKQFMETHGSTKPRPLTTEEAAQVEQANHEEIQKRIELYKKIAYVIAALLAFILIYVIQKVVRRYENESKVARENKEAVKSQLGTPDTSATTPATPTPNGDEKTALAPVGTVPPVDKPKEEPKKEEPKKESPKPEVKKEEPKKEEPKKDAPKPETTPLVLAKPAAPTPVAKPEAPAAPKPEVKTEKPKEEKKPEPKKEEAPKADAKPTKTKPQEIIIEALDNVEVRYTKDGDSEKTVKLKPEQVLTIHATSKISLSVSDSGAVNITHNGHDAGVPGSLGQPTKLSYP